MANQIGNYSLFIALFASIFLIFQSSNLIRSKSKNLDSKIFSALSVQSLMVLISFFSLIYAFIISDFSNETVYNNSHTTKPLFYKISGSWGNHEGSLLLWLLVLTIFLFVFLISSKKLLNKYRLLTILFQELIIIGFLLFILFTSNPFLNLFPIPKEGTGLNPILQDPALAIHPPLLYLGFVGSSIYFSQALASLISKFYGKNFANIVRPWVLVSWFFQTLGILVGSIWAYYELGWGGFWFWDPVENSSLIPWFLMTALLHSILVLSRRESLYLWVIVLSILTFTMSVTGTFLVRSGILNSVHTFANDPSRGLYILVFLSTMIFSSLYIFYKFSPKEELGFKLFSKEFFILTNNWFMIFFLITVLIGTIYPLFLEIIANEKISIGPPYYNTILAPFLVPLLFLMSFGPRTGLIAYKKSKITQPLSILSLSIFVILFFIYFTNQKNILINVILISAIYLILQTFLDLFKNIRNRTEYLFSTGFSHIGFGFLILFISLNSIFSVEYDFNMKIGEKRKMNKYEIILQDLEISSEKNYKKFVGDLKIFYNKNNSTEFLRPEIRIYDQPETITYEASIKSNILSDTYVTMSNISKSDFYNIKFQKKPFMNLIWFSTILIAFGGLIRILKRKN